MTENNHALSTGYELTTYTIDKILGQGGFGIVYQAHHSYLNDKFVIKEFLPSSLATRSNSNASIVPVSNTNNALFDDSYKRFIDEGRTLRKLKHPNIVRCTDLFEANGTAYLVMEFEDGLPFDELLKSLEATGGQYSEAHLLQVFIPLAEGLEYVHQQNVLHRDIKPANVFIRRSDNSPVLLDFGAAKQNYAEVSQSQAPFTEFYAPIDQLDTTLKPKPTIDIHAFGGLMYRAVTGTIGPKAEKRSYALSRGESDPLEPASHIARSQYSKGLLELIDQCLAFLPENRPQSMAEIHSRLQSLVGEQGTYTEPKIDKLSQLNELISLAGSDGIITEVEMAHLLNKASQFGLDHAQAIQQITSQCHTNGWEFEIGKSDQTKESITQPESSFSEAKCKEFLDPFIELAGTDEVITEQEIFSIIEQGKKKSIAPDFTRAYIKEKANQLNWQVEPEESIEKQNKTNEVILDDFIENQKLSLDQTKNLIRTLVSQLKAIKPLNYDRLNIDSSTVWVKRDLSEFGFSEEAFIDADPREKYQDISLFSFSPEYYLNQKIEQSSVVYSLACIAYLCLTGTRVWTDERLKDDEVVLLGTGGNNFFKAIDWGMTLKKTQRPSSINQWVKSWTHGVPAKKKSPKSKLQNDAKSESAEKARQTETKSNRYHNKPKQSSSRPKDENVKRERPNINRYKPTFLDYLDTFFQFINGIVIYGIIAAIFWGVLGNIIEFIGDFEFKKSTHQIVLGVLAVICFLVAFPTEIEKNGLKKADARYAEISLFFIGVVIIGAIAAAIHFF